MRTAKNDFLLRVSGEKIAPPKRTTTKKTYYQVRAAPVDERPRGEDDDNNNNKGDPSVGECDRQVLPLKKTHVKDSDVCSPQLRQIRETVEVEDFQRLLRRFTSTQQRTAARPKRYAGEGGVNLTNIYKEFFQDHYDLLRDVISRTRTT